jgi:SnoaL-like domain
MIAVELSQPVRQYFESRNAFDVSSALDQFEDSAVVRDEDLEYRGHDSIRTWIEETQRKYQATFDVRAVEQARGSLVVGTLVSGTFPGSPLPIDHAFVVSNGKISRLVIG